MMAMNPDVSFWLWQEEGVEKTLGLSLDDLRRRFPSWAGVSNAVRLHIVNRFGGGYMDLDFQPIKPLLPLFEAGDAVVAKQEGDRTCNAIFLANAGHPWVRWQVNHLSDIERLGAFAGVDHMTRAPRTGLTIIPPQWVYSWRWDAPKEKRIVHPEAIVVHQWAGTWLNHS
jgi:mannosyltransferase OCH1-like enzyme